MERICELGAKNVLIQQEIDGLKAILDNINIVVSGQVTWQEDIVLSLVSNNIKNDIELLEFDKENNKKEMANLLLQSLSL